MIDVKSGDVLVIGAKEYPVKSAADWSGNFRSITFARQARTAASTKRSQVSSGKIQPASTFLTGLKVTPLDPVSAELATSAGLETPFNLRQCFLGDTAGFLHLIVEDLQR